MLRQVVPVRGSILGHNYYDGSDRDIGYGALGIEEGMRESDILPYSKIYCPNQSFADSIIQNTYNHRFSGREFYIRYARPHYARIVEAYLDFSCVFSGNNGVRIVMTDCGSNLLPQTLPRSTIDALWKQATGKAQSITGNGRLSCSGLNLKEIIPDGQSEAFAICLAFDSPPQNLYIEQMNLLLGTEVLV